jgi:hypothetical protein
MFATCKDPLKIAEFAVTLKVFVGYVRADDKMRFELDDVTVFPEGYVVDPMATLTIEPFKGMTVFAHDDTLIL